VSHNIFLIGWRFKGMLSTWIYADYSRKLWALTIQRLYSYNRTQRTYQLALEGNKKVKTRCTAEVLERRHNNKVRDTLYVSHWLKHSPIGLRTIQLPSPWIKIA